ncbi:MAG: hypothetical protein ABI818_09925 [Acidobacteriota bacterium]
MGTRTRMMRRAGQALAIAALAAWSSAWVDAARPAGDLQQDTGLQREDGPKRETVSADISITRRRVNADGTADGLPTQVAYHWMRERVNGKWRTVVTVPSSLSWAIDPLTRAPREMEARAVRVEDSEDGTPLRFFTRTGQLVRIPSAPELSQVRGTFSKLPAAKQEMKAPPPPQKIGTEMARPSVTAAGQSWADTLVIDPSTTLARRAALERANGAPKGRVGGLDRFVTYKGDAAIETLVQPSVAVPVQVNVVRNSALVMQTVITYAAGTGGTLVRQRLYSTRVTDAAGTRATVDMQYSNVRTVAGVAQ